MYNHLIKTNKKPKITPRQDSLVVDATPGMMLPRPCHELESNT